MANWCGAARSNYFRVKDRVAFDKWVSSVPIEVVEHIDGTVAMLSMDPDSGGWPSAIQPDVLDDGHEFILQDVAQYLVDGEVAIFMEAGAEKLRYITAFALAVHSSGEFETIFLSDIYAIAGARWDVSPTAVSY